MRIDLSESKNKLNKISIQIDKLINIYKSLQWKDYVYESYRAFILNDLKNLSDTTRNVSNNFTNIESNAAHVEDSDSVKSKIDGLYSEASTIEI